MPDRRNSSNPAVNPAGPAPMMIALLLIAETMSIRGGASVCFIHADCRWSCLLPAHDDKLQTGLSDRHRYVVSVQDGAVENLDGEFVLDHALDGALQRPR